ncbi:MAG TPA: polyprenol monophosphomannose synthase [Thermoleophilaceae bacterium]|nr:polyprenol monophosphomannose synthase [Thermoleophilaceae bacterium]
MAGTWLILPTYNEAENIEAVVRASLAQLEEVGGPHTVLIVDDNSPDGTGEIAARLAEEHDRVRVLHRPSKRGLGRAYLAGFAVALEDGAELVLEMDSDFSHDPADLPRLIAAAGAADLVLGSRYVPGGGVVNWGLVRRALSRGGCAYARILLGVPVRDLTGGFKCFHRRVLEALDLSDVHADGYGFQIELTYRAAKAGFTVAEVPILFRERRVGQSKMTPRIAVEAVWKVPALRFRGRREA